MAFLEIIILAVVQGITEFLPISSSGHVVVLSALFDQLGLPLDHDKVTVNIVLHLGTLAAIVAFYRQRIVALVSRDRAIIPRLIVATLPAVVVGLLLKDNTALQSALIAGLMFPITGTILMVSARLKPGETTCAALSYRAALWIGIAQALAVLPGISRSGATIVAGLGCGLRRDEAATFSFLMAIPVIAGGGLLEVRDLIASGADTNGLAILVLGALVAFVVGLAALAWLVRWLQEGRLYLFAWWVILLGPIVVAWQLLGT